MQIKSVRSAFWLKQLLAVLLAGLADMALWSDRVGSTLGALGLGILLAALIVRPPTRGDRRALLAFSAAALLSLAVLDHPTLLAALLFAVVIGLAVLSKRAGRAGDAFHWAQRLMLAGLAGLIAPLLDLHKLHKTRPRRRIRLSGGLFQLILPLLGGALFLSLFAAANPLIAQLLAQLQIPALDFGRCMLWAAALLIAWMVLRPRLLDAPFATPGGREVRLPGVTPTSVGLSLLLFNAIFALQNGLDIVFLWSGAALPEGVTLADYAHKGAYTLIATAILAGLFVLVALQPGSAMAKSGRLRALVVLWVAQNLLLVASSVLRTLDYVQAYSLTRLRIAALIWMGLVAVGLVLICWRMLRSKSAGWLINANVAAAGVVLAACCVVDLGAVAAAWNVRNAREVGGAGTALDLQYLKTIGEAALVPLSELERRPLDSAFRSRVEDARSELLATLAIRQASWRGWTWRGQRRLEAARTPAPHPAPPPALATSSARPS
jgi:hypothetical protein